MHRFSKRARTLLAAGALVAPFAAAAPASAVTIVPQFDSSITKLPNAATVEAAFDTVARDYDSAFSNPVTVNVGVSWGSVDGRALPSAAVGASIDNLYGYYSYAQVRSDLARSSASNPADTALASAVTHLPTAAPSGPSRYLIPSAEAKALGLVAGGLASDDGYVGFSGSPSGYTFSGATGAGTYDFRAVAAHELAEVLGRISGVSSASPSWLTPFDLYRYKSSGALDESYADRVYFSANGGATSLKYFNNSTSGGDRGDWLSISGVNDVQNAFLGTGTSGYLSAVDLTSLDVLGWGGANLGDTAIGSPTRTVVSLSSAAPEPETWTLLIGGFFALGTILRARRRAPVRSRDQGRRASARL